MDWIKITEREPPKGVKIIAIGESRYDGEEDEVETGYAEQDITQTYWCLKNMGEGLRRLKFWAELELPK